VAQKNKAKGGAKLDAATAVRRSLARQDYKQALKEAKTAWRQQPTSELRTLLEEAYLERTKQLLRFGFTAEARSTFEDLLALGITEAKVRQEATTVAAPLGLLSQVLGHQGPSETITDPSILRVLADSAVLRPGSAPSNYPEIARDAAAVREALDQLAAGQTEAALAGLAHIPRNSPLADWRLFVRGLAAYYRQDDEEMAACWDRLDPARVPAKIARNLRSLAEWIRSGSPTLEGLGAGGRALLQVEKAAFGEPVLSRLCELHSQTAERDWEGALRTLRNLPRTLGPQKRPLALLAAQAVMASATKDITFRFMERVTKEFPGPPSDPRWNRAWARFHEAAEEGDLTSAARHWIDYVQDIDQGALPADDRRLAKALVWHRAALNYLTYLREYAGEEEDEEEFEESEKPGPLSEPAKDAADSVRKAAVAALMNSIELAPELVKPYRDLASAYLRWGQPDKAAEVYRRLLDRHPDSLEDLQALASLLVDAGKPVEACTYARKAYHLKPLNRPIATLLWRCLVESARYYAMQQRWDNGRAMLAEAASLDPAAEDASILPAFQAVLEFKAGDVVHARSLVWEAVNKAPHPAAALLAVALQAKRWDAPRHWATMLDSQWAAELQGRFNSKAAAAMARVLSRTDEWGESPSETPEYLQRFIDYMARGVKCKWNRQDLLDVCRLLHEQWDRLDCDDSESEYESASDAEDTSEGTAARLEKLLKALATRGIRLFPDEPIFLATLGDLVLSDGPAIWDRPYARYLFRQLRSLTENASDPERRELYQRAEVALDMLGPGPVSSKPGKRASLAPQQLLYEMLLSGVLRIVREEKSEEDEGEEEASRGAHRQPKRRSPR